MIVEEFLPKGGVCADHKLIAGEIEVWMVRVGRSIVAAALREARDRANDAVRESGS